MATSTVTTKCVACWKETHVIKCEGCSKLFCCVDLPIHHLELNQQLDEIEKNRNLLEKSLAEIRNDFQQHLLFNEIDKWEKESIKKIKKAADESRQLLYHRLPKHCNLIETNLIRLTDRLKDLRQQKDFNETNLNDLEGRVIKLSEEFHQPSTIGVYEDDESFLKKIVVSISNEPFEFSPSPRPLPPVNINTGWKHNGITIAGGNGEGSQLNQLSCPCAIDIDDRNQTIYIADARNNRIVEWKFNASNGEVIAGGNGFGNRMDQLSYPTDVIVDQKNDALIICDQGNKRIVKWPCQRGTVGEIIISDINCSCLAMDRDGNLYVFDSMKNEVRRCKIGDTNEIVVAGGNGHGDDLNQLNGSSSIFVDQDYSVYVAESHNHRVTKWMKDAKEGIVVAGGEGRGYGLRQFYYPQAIHVDHLGDVYVADQGNERIVRWSKRSQKGTIVVGGYGQGQQPNQFNYPFDISFDQEGHLYVIDYNNHRVQKFEKNSE